MVRCDQVPSKTQSVNPASKVQVQYTGEPVPSPLISLIVKSSAPDNAMSVEVFSLDPTIALKFIADGAIQADIVKSPSMAGLPIWT